jgi:hypothetical protein
MCRRPLPRSKFQLDNWTMNDSNGLAKLVEW